MEGAGHSTGDAGLIEAVSDHVERHLGPIDPVLHERESPIVHVDVLVVGPQDGVPYQTLVTCGMSERPMPVPADEAGPRAELFLGLAPDWPLEVEALRDERHWWPIRLLKQLARLPHEEGTVLWERHTVGDPTDAPFAEGTELCAALVAPPLLVPDGFRALEEPGADPIFFFTVVPLHAAELRLARDEGTDALIARLADAEVDLVVDPARPSVA